MVLVSTSVHLVERDPYDGFHQCVCYHGELQLPPGFLETLQ